MLTSEAGRTNTRNNLFVHAQITGNELCKQLQSSERIKIIPVIFTSALDRVTYR